MTAIKTIQDDSGNKVFPITHERAVRDDNGVTLESKLQNINSAIGTTIPNQFVQVDSSIDQLLAANAELRTTVNNLVGISNDNFMGIFQTVNDLPTITSPGWALVGTNLASLLLYTHTNVNDGWTKYRDDTYNFTDYSGLVSQVATIGSKIGDLAELETTDKSSLVGAINEVAAAVISAGSSNIFDVNQNGFYFVDSNYNIGAYFDNSGFHAINMIEYEEVNNG